MIPICVVLVVHLLMLSVHSFKTPAENINYQSTLDSTADDDNNNRYTSIAMLLNLAKQQQMKQPGLIDSVPRTSSSNNYNTIRSDDVQHHSNSDAHKLPASWLKLFGGPGQQQQMRRKRSLPLSSSMSSASQASNVAEDLRLAFATMAANELASNQLSSLNEELLNAPLSRLDLELIDEHSPLMKLISKCSNTMPLFVCVSVFRLHVNVCGV